MPAAQHITTIPGEHASWENQNSILENINNYKYVKFNIEKIEHILDSMEEEYGAYFAGNLDIDIADYMSNTISCWTNPNFTEENIELSSTVWLGFPSRGNIDFMLERDYLIKPKEFNFDKHLGMLYWCGDQTNDHPLCLETSGRRCPTCEHNW
tara:strand:- start:2909 stop:3367 length:459 start_codon:yes stop_codon:yes gene_type:complete